MARSIKEIRKLAASSPGDLTPGELRFLQSQAKEQGPKPLKFAAALARRLGVNQTTIREYLANPTFPEPQGPWDEAMVERCREWQSLLQADRNKNQAKGGGAGGAGGSGEFDGIALARSIKEAELKIKTEKHTTMAIDRRIKEQEYILRAEIESNQAKKFEAVKKSLQQIAKSLRQILADEMDPDMVEQIMLDAFRAVIGGFFVDKKKTEIIN